jgi:hypothetical protein
MEIVASATGHLVRLDLHGDGTLVLTPSNRAAAAWLFGLPKVEPICLRPDMVDSISDTLPSPDGVMLGWLVVHTCGTDLRLPYRLRAQPHVRYLLREAAALGYPARHEVGQRQREPELAMG